MGAAGAIEVLEGRAISAIKDPEEKAVFISEKVNEYKEKFANPYQAAAFGFIDDIIEPRNTRFRIIRAFQALETKKVVNPPKKHNNIPL
jgi:acetyl-CoA carboxylase carboxyltransferase component